MKRFTLANLLLFLAIAALSISLILSNRQLSIARTELTKLRNEIRVLDPTHSDKMRAIEIPSFGRNQWRWRVDLPDHEKFVLRWTFDGIPMDKSIPTTIDPVYNAPKFVPPDLPSDEFILSIAAFEESGVWTLGVSAQSISGLGEMDFAIPMEANDSSWLSRRGGNSVHQLAGSRDTENCPVDERFVVLRYRKGISPRSGVTAFRRDRHGS